MYNVDGFSHDICGPFSWVFMEHSEACGGTGWQAGIRDNIIPGINGRVLSVPIK